MLTQLYRNPSFYYYYYYYYCYCSCCYCYKYKPIDIISLLLLLFLLFLLLLLLLNGSVSQAVRLSPAIAGIPSSLLGQSMWTSWLTKRNLLRFFLGFLLFTPAINFIPPFLHTDFIHFVSFHQPYDGESEVLHSWPASMLFTDLQCGVFNASHSTTRPWVGQELILTN